jgi:hypothetical protein
MRKDTATTQRWKADCMKETRLIRLPAQIPNFLLEPATYALGGGFFQVNLVNYAQAASNIHVESTWGKKDAPGSTTLKFLILSLSNRGHADLHSIPIAQIVASREILTVKITCRDTCGEHFKISPLLIHFENIANHNETVAYQFSELRPIPHELEK